VRAEYVDGNIRQRCRARELATKPASQFGPNFLIITVLVNQQARGRIGP
jgi:hypothetical protein